MRIFLALMSACLLLLPMEAFAHSKPESECIIGYELDWTGVKKPERGQLFNFHPPFDRYFWQGKQIPDFARFVEQYWQSTYYLPQLEGSLPKEIYFVINRKQHCPRKEELTKQYFDFWQSRGLELPHIKRIPDPIKPFEPEELKAKRDALRAQVKSMPDKPYGQCLLGVKFDWTGVPPKQLNVSISNSLSQPQLIWRNTVIPGFALAIRPVQQGELRDQSGAIIRRFYEVQWEYCFKKEKLWKDYMTYLQVQPAFVPRYELIPDDRTQGQMKAVMLVQKYKEEKRASAVRDQQFWTSFKLPDISNPFKQPHKKKEHAPQPDACIIAFSYDWSAVKNPKALVGRFGLYSDSRNREKAWGANIPDFAQYMTTHEIGAPLLDERMLPARIYYKIPDEYCDKKEEYALQYMEFWRSQGESLPKIKRVPDSEIPKTKK